MTLRYFNFIPTYNNPKSIQEIVERTLTISKNPLLIVDDGSSIKVQELLKKSVITKKALNSNRFFIKRFSSNRGKGAALKFGIEWGVSKNFTHMISIDSDGQFAPEEIPKIQKVSVTKPWNYILGERIFPESAPKSSVFGRRFSNMWVKIETGKRLGDTQTGFRCYPLFWVQNISSFRNRFAFELELIVKGLWLGADATSFPVSVLYPEDRVSHFKKIKDNLSLTLLHTQLCCQHILNLIFMNKKKSWTGKQSKNAAIGTKIFIRLINFSGLKAPYFLLVFVSLFYYIFNISARNSLKEYWLNLNPNIGFYSLRKNVFLNIYRFGQVLIDFYYIKSSKHVQEMILSNFTKIKIEENILLSGHFGYWNVAANLFNQFFSKQIKTVEYTDSSRNFENIAFGKNSREHITPSSAAENKAIFSFYESQTKDQVTAGLIDRPVGSRYELVRFFNRLMPIDISFGLAASTLNSKVSFFTLSKISISEFKYNFERPKTVLSRKDPASSFKWACEFSRFYEKALKDSPNSWANFYTPWKIHPSVAIPLELQQKVKKKPKVLLINPLES